jgi:uncharacterized damage-inducible protein DinB
MQAQPDSHAATERTLFGRIEDFTVDGFVLDVFLSHAAHHCGRTTVFMRQAGLPVHGVYGPSSEEWLAMGLQPMP